MSVTEFRTDPSLGHLVHRAWRPSPGDPLAGLVASIADCDGIVFRARERVFPSGEIELILHLDEPYRVLTPRGTEPYPVACVSGIFTAPILMEAPPDRTRIVSVRLRPAAALALCRRPLSELTARTVNLHDVLAPAGVAELVERCLDARSAIDRIWVVRSWLGERLRTIHAADDITWAAAQIVRHRGALGIDALRGQIGRSWARFANDFRERVGVTPKRYARIVRFSHALRLVGASARLPLASVALAAGYYDQAHMNAEFRALGGLTPGEFRLRPHWPDAVSVAEVAG